MVSCNFVETFEIPGNQYLLEISGKKRVLLSRVRAFGDIYATCLLPTFMRFEVVLNRHKT